jgi:hypothetical protein
MFHFEKNFFIKVMGEMRNSTHFKNLLLIETITPISYKKQNCLSAATIEKPCPEGTMTCDDGVQCVSLNARCDGRSKCDDGSDESEKTCRGLH